MSSVSVVVPCYRYGHFLRGCLDSVLHSNPGVDVRVLVVDDASPDDSADVARALAAEDPRVQVQVHPENRGHIRTYNEGLLDWADGDYTVLLSADDRLTPGALTRAVALLDAHPEVAFAYGHPLHVPDGEPLPVARTAGRGWRLWTGQRWIERQFDLGHGCITSPEVVVRTSVQQAVGGYDPALPHAGDLEMWLRLAAHGDVGYLRGVDQAYYRLHAASMSKSTFAAHAADLEQRLEAYESALDRSRGRVQRPDRLRRTVRRRIAVDALWHAARGADRPGVDPETVARLLDFAERCSPDVHRSATGAALRVRRALPAAVPVQAQPLAVGAVYRRAREHAWQAAWRRRGV